MKKTLVMLGGVLLIAATASAAQARSNIGISINSGGYYAPAPVYYAPQPVYYAPPPVAYQPYYPTYSPYYRVNYWNGPRYHGGGYGRGHGHGRGHGRSHGGWR